MPLFYELVVDDVQVQDRAVHDRSDSDVVGKDLGIVGSRIRSNAPQNPDPCHSSVNNDAGAQKFTRSVESRFRFIRRHNAPLAEQEQPCREGDGCG